MTERDFRAKHSELIGYYQLIEMRLKGICAGMLTQGGNDWFMKLDDYQADPFGALLHKIKELQDQTQEEVLAQKDLEALDNLRKTRNYWVHQCFVGKDSRGTDQIVFTRRGELKRPIYAEKLEADLEEAVEWDEKLTQVFRGIRVQPPKF